MQQAGGQFADGLGEGGGEQQGLAASRQQCQDLVQFPAETEIQHAIGLVQHQHLQLAQLQRVLGVQVEQSPGRGDQYVGAPAQCHHLRIEADSTIGDGDAQWQVSTIVAQLVADLLGQFARGREHQGAHAVGGGRCAVTESLQQRQRKAGGLAGAGLRGGDQITSSQDQRNGLRLYRRGCLVVQLDQGSQQRVDQSEVREIHVCCVRPELRLVSGMLALS